MSCDESRGPEKIQEAPGVREPLWLPGGPLPPLRPPPGVPDARKGCASITAKVPAGVAAHVAAHTVGKPCVER